MSQHPQATPFDVHAGSAPASPPAGATTSRDAERRRIARRRAGARLGFLIHLAVYVVVNVALFAIDTISSPQVSWAQYPLLGWGLGLAIHGLVVHLLPMAGTLHARLTERELRRMQD